MGWVWVASYIGTFMTLGSVGYILSGDGESKNNFHVLGFIIIFGLGCFGYGQFLLSLFGIPLERLAFTIVTIFGIVGFLSLYVKKKPNFKIPLGRGAACSGLQSIIIYILSILLVTFLLLVIVHSLTFPLYEWDAFAIWGLKAKVIFAHGINPQPYYFSDLNLSYSHLDYPLLVPFLISSVYKAIGTVNDQMGKLSFPFFYFGLLCLIFSYSRERLSLVKSLVITVLVMGAPVMLRWAGAGNADVPLTCFYTASLIYMLKWVEKQEWTMSLFSALFAVFAAFTKNEGLMLGAINCLVMLILSIHPISWKKKLTGAGIYVLVFLSLILPWIIWAGDIPRTHENYSAHLSLSQIYANLYRIPIILTEFFSQIFHVWRYGLLWLLLMVSVLVGWRAYRDQITLLMWVLLLLHLSCYFLVFLITPWDVQVHLDVALDRLFLHAVPLAGLLLVQHHTFLPKGLNANSIR